MADRLASPVVPKLGDRYPFLTACRLIAQDTAASRSCPTTAASLESQPLSVPGLTDEWAVDVGIFGLTILRSKVGDSQPTVGPISTLCAVRHPRRHGRIGKQRQARYGRRGSPTAARRQPGQGLTTTVWHKTAPGTRRGMQATVRKLLDTCGQTYAEQAGIRLADKPAPLYRLLVLTVLLSIRIQADIAVAAARELIRSGFGTPRRMLEASWQQRVDALGRAHYVRYDESTATALGDGAQLVLGEYRGDLRRLRQAGDGDVRELRRLLQQVPRIGQVGADIFCREAQAIWPELRPYLDRRARQGARRLHLPTQPDRLAELVPSRELARFSAALVRVTLDDELARQLTG
jgi:hypothetical protein